MKKNNRGIFITVIMFFILLDGSAPLLNAESVVPDGYDPQRYISIDQLRRGMKGYGLTVFEGTRIEKFDVEVISVMTSRTVGRNAFIIKCRDQRFEVAKGVQGVSGSPVFFNGKLAGAMAFGWAFGEEPLYGVTPIHEMLAVRKTGLLSRDKSAKVVKSGFHLEKSLYRNMFRDKLLDEQQLRRIVQQSGLTIGGKNINLGGTDMVQLPLAISCEGVSVAAAENLRSCLPGLNLQAGVSPADMKTFLKESELPKLTPGATLIIPLIKGDFNAAVIGTVTEVVGKQVFGFGHPYNGDGAVSWPLGTGYIHTFVNSKYMSFKLGQLVEVVGAVQADEAVGIFGHTGDQSPMGDVKVTVDFGAEKEKRQFNLQFAQDDAKTAVLAATCLTSSITYKDKIPKLSTIEYKINMDFDGAEDITFTNITSERGLVDILSETVSSLSLMCINPFSSVKLNSLVAEIKITDQSTLSFIKEVYLNQTVYRPGQTIMATVIYDVYRNKDKTAEISLKLPDDIPDGKYKVTVSDEPGYRKALARTQPHMAIAYNSADIQKVLQHRLSFRRDSIYMTILLSNKSSLTIGTEALPSLPGSKAMLLTDSSRHIYMGKSPQMIWANKPIEHVLIGAEIFDITVRRD